MMYPLESFFQSHDECMDFFRKLHNDNYVLVLLGTGGNGKTQICSQILSMSPNGYFKVVNEGERIPVRSPARKIIYVTNSSMDEVDNFSHDIVEMTKQF